LETKASQSLGRNDSDLSDAIELLGQEEPELRHVLQVMAQATAGPYPPPMMLREYKQIDPAIVEHILDRANKQSQHRQELEQLTTSGSERRLDRAQRHQTLIAILAVVGGVGLVGVTQALNHPVSWVFPAILVAIGVGGRPVATIATRWLTLSNNQTNSKDR
jgi:uncharacterized membrane protein